MASSKQYYLKNPKLKAANVTVPFTEEQRAEFVRCAIDPVYFINNYVQIVHVDHGLVPFHTYPYQDNLINTMHNKRYTIVLSARQTGKSTTTVSYILWYILFNKRKQVAILANKAITAREILSRLQLAYEQLPFWMQQGVVTWNKGYIELENGSKVMATSTSASAIRGFSCNLVMLDEFAHIDNNKADDFFTSVFPTISSGKTTKIVVVSTPKGMNHFYKMWMDAVNEVSKFTPVKVHWSDVPGRDAAWAEEERANVGEERWQQEYEVEFLGGQNTLIPAKYLKMMAAFPPVYIDKEKMGFHIFEMPKPGHIYVQVADTAHGKGMDYSATQVIDITEYPFRQVASYKNNDVTTLVFPMIIYHIGKLYNWADTLVETNDAGIQTANILHFDLEYPNVVWFAGTIGILTNRAVKFSGCSTFKQIVESQKIEIKDVRTIQELSTFILHGKTYQADEGMNDDLAMCLVLFGWFTATDYFKDLTNKDMREKIAGEKARMIEEDVMPFGFFMDGTEDAEEMENLFS